MKRAVGIKMYVGEDISDMDYKEFLKHTTCNISGLYVGDQQLECKYYDDETGEMYLHFENPIPRDELIGYFKEENIINELSTISQISDN